MINVTSGRLYIHKWKPYVVLNFLPICLSVSFQKCQMSRYYHIFWCRNVRCLDATIFPGVEIQKMPLCYNSPLFTEMITHNLLYRVERVLRILFLVNSQIVLRTYSQYGCSLCRTVYVVSSISFISISIVMVHNFVLLAFCNIFIASSYLNWT